MRTRCDHTAAWRLLQSRFDSIAKTFDLRNAFENDPQRFTVFSQDAPHVFADLSKNLIDTAVEQQLFELARQCGLEQHRDAMFSGALVNSTEQRAVMHFLLRNSPPAQYIPAHAAIDKIADLQAEVHACLDSMLDYAEQGVVPGRTADVTSWASEFALWNADADESVWMRVLCDPQTSGGLLIAVSADDADRMADELGARGVLSARVGSCTADHPGRVVIR